MEVHFGWGKREVKFVSGDGKISPHVAWTHRECGGHDASPTGVSYHWWSEPSQLPSLIWQLQQIHAEYELWEIKELARYQAQGSPMSNEQISRIDQARAAGVL